MKLINFATTNHAALASLPALLERWLPNGRREGRLTMAPKGNDPAALPSAGVGNIVHPHWNKDEPHECTDCT